MQNDSINPLCYRCKHRGEVPGDTHSCCNHPEARRLVEGKPLMQIAAIFGSARKQPMVNVRAIGVEGDPHGIQMGWFNWPLNFDPVWLLKCDGYEERKTDGQTAK